MLGMSLHSLDSSAQSILTSSYFLVNISCSVQLPVIKGVGAQFRVWAACRRMSPQCLLIQSASINIIWAVSSNLVTTMSNSRSYLVTLVASQPYSSTLVALSYSGHGHTEILPLSMTLGLVSIQSLSHLPAYPVLT